MFINIIKVIKLQNKILRLHKKLQTTQNKILFMIYLHLFEKELQKNGSSIGAKTEFANEPFFPHGITGIFISQGAKIGKDAVIFQQVTIGSNTLKGSKSYGAPVIGDNCYIGAGAKIIGGIKIGDNVRIGANAVVVKDVPDNAVVVNQPGRIIIKENLENKFASL